MHIDEFSFESVAADAFSEPTDTVFHYTRLKAFTEIVKHKHIFASDVRYMNDSAELTHAVELVRRARERRSHGVDTGKTFFARPIGPTRAATF